MILGECKNFSIFLIFCAISTTLSTSNQFQTLRTFIFSWTEFAYQIFDQTHFNMQIQKSITNDIL